FSKSDSTHQKQPPAKIALEVLAPCAWPLAATTQDSANATSHFANRFIELSTCGSRDYCARTCALRMDSGNSTKARPRTRSPPPMTLTRVAAPVVRLMLNNSDTPLLLMRFRAAKAALVRPLISKPLALCSSAVIPSEPTGFRSPLFGSPER